MARALVLPISTPADTDGLDDTARGLDRMRRAADNAGKDFKGLEKDSNSLGKQITITRDRVHRLIDELNRTGDVGFLKEIRSAKRDLKAFEEAAVDLEKFNAVMADTGTEVHRTTRDFRGLQVEIENTKARIKELQFQISKTGDVGLFGDLRREEHKLRSLVNVLKAITPEVGIFGIAAGTAFAKGFMDTVGALPAQLKGIAILSAVGIAAAMAPVLGGVIAGAVTGVTGIGGIAGGIFAASKDPRVRAAAKGFGESISKEFFGSGGAFVDPIVDALHILEVEFKGLNLGDAFAKVAPFVDDLAKGLAGLVKNIMPGLNETFDNLGPIMDVLADELPEVGAAFGDMLGDMSESEGAATGLKAAFEALEVTLRFTGDAVSFLSDRLREFAVFGARASGKLEDILAVGGRVSPALRKAAEQTREYNDRMEDLVGETEIGVEGQLKIAKAVTGHTIPGLSATGDAASDAAKKFEELNKKLHENIRLAFSGFNANIDFQQAIDDLAESVRGKTKSLKDDNKSLDVNTDGGRNNLRILGRMVDAAHRARDAILEKGKGTTQAQVESDKAFDRMIAKAKADAIALGLPRAAVERIVDELAQLKPKSVSVTTPGAKVATRQVQDLQREIRELRDKTVSINVKYRYGPKPIPNQHGGPVFKGQAYIVGEKRPELFVPETNGRIIPKVPPEARPVALMPGGGGTGGGGGNTYNINVEIGPGGNVHHASEEIIRLIQHYEKCNGNRWRTL